MSKIKNPTLFLITPSFLGDIYSANKQDRLEEIMVKDTYRVLDRKGFYDEDVPRNIRFLGDPGLVTRFNRGGIVGIIKTPNGEVRYGLSLTGIMIIEPPKIGIELYAQLSNQSFYLPECTGVEIKVPSPEFILTTSTNGLLDRWISGTSRVAQFSKAYLAEQKVMAQVRYDTAAEWLRQNHIEPTKALVDAYYSVLHFDHTFEESDDNAMCIRYREFERKLMEQIKGFPALVKLKSDGSRRAYGLDK